MLKTYWARCSKYANYSKLDSNINGSGDFHFDKELHTHMSSEIFGANGYGHNLGVFDQLAVIILQEVGVEKKISI